MSKTAILVDGGLYRKRSNKLWGSKTPEEAADALFAYCLKHLNERKQTHELYRIFYYDCPPIEKQLYHPLLKSTINLKTTDHYIWMQAFLDELKKKRKVALRLGTLDSNNSTYTLKYDAMKKLVAGSIGVGDLGITDFELDLKQKGVDMKIGVDIASLAYKRQVEQIVLIAGDSDFVPAAKLARREGIDFVLDPLEAPIKDELFEHIDGKRSCGNPYKNKKSDNDAFKV